MHNSFLLLLICLLLAMCVSAGAAPNTGRERLLMDFGWKFQFGRPSDVNHSAFVKAGSAAAYNVGYDDAGWRSLDLPHDWAAEMPFSPNADEYHGYRTVGKGFPDTSIGWYARRFEIPAGDLGRRISIEFDGVFRDSQVWLNGYYLGRSESGYSPFKFDITDYLNYGGQNRLVVRVDTTSFEGWFYEGAGIYRHVWMVKTNAVHVPQWGTFVTSEVKGDNAKVTARTRVANDGRTPSDFTLSSVIKDADGRELAKVESAKQTLKASGETEIVQVFDVPNPKLWSPETPHLYSLSSSIKSGNVEVDTFNTSFGIRTVAFDLEKGFILNGKPYVIKGTCNHQDHAGVGSAMPDRLQYYRIERLKEMGCNAYRTSHNPPTPELLEACDRLGMLVMDENRLLGVTPEYTQQLEKLILRDRNHACVFVWSIGNEEWAMQDGEPGARIAQTMCDIAHQLDPTRLTTYAGNNGGQYEGVNKIVDVRGWNYAFNQTDKYKKAHPNQFEIGTEQASTLCTRGEYAVDKAKCFMSAYDDTGPGWGATAEAWWKYFAERPYLSGGFVWTGFDYRGEPTPYSWPAVSSQFGIMDTCGFAKDNFYYYQAWWSDKPVLHILPHWNWPGKEGQDIDVRCFTNCTEVRLFLNGQALGRQAVNKNSHAKYTVKYAPGTLEAVGYNGHIEMMRTKIETTSAPAGVKLIPDRSTINADGEDISLVTVAVVDDQDRIVPTADNEVRFELAGEGSIIGVGNGSPTSHEPDIMIGMPELRTLDKWRFKMIDGTDNRPEVAEKFDDASWPLVNAESPQISQENTSAVLRTQFEISQSDLDKDKINIYFGSIDDFGWVYVNGKKAAETADWRHSWTLDIKPFLKPGTNTVAVVVKNQGNTGGITGGTRLEIAPKAGDWKRKCFNGLCQIIVKSTKKSGAIIIKGTVDGLKPGEVEIKTSKCNIRPAVP